MKTDSLTAQMGKLSTNCMGTTDVELKLANMRKFQSFIVYPLHGNDNNPNQLITIQSNSRIGQLSLLDGKGEMSQSHSNGAYFHNFALDKRVPFVLSPVDLAALKMYIFTTASKLAGTNGIVFTDNSGAGRVL